MGFIDPTPVLEERYQKKLEALRSRLGEPNGFWHRRRFNRERRKLRRRIFGRLRRVTGW